MGYKDYLETEHWKNFRKKVYKSKRGKKCRVCGSTYHLNIHHRKYFRQNKSVLFNEKLGGIIVVCRECHLLWHKYHGTKIAFRGKHADRIKNMLRLGYSKEVAFQHCWGKDYRKFIINNKPSNIT